MEQYLAQGETVVVGCSAGPDSMFLLNMLLPYREELNINIIPALYQHNQDPKYEQESLSLLTKYCGEQGLSVVSALSETLGPRSTEAEMRAERYKWLGSVCRKYGSSSLFVGHQMNDQIETVLFNMARGTLQGLSGMREVRELDNEEPKVNLIRPMLGIKRSIILDELHRLKIPYMLDPSNWDTSFSRNAMRHKVLPVIEENFPAFVRNVGRNLDLLQEDQDYLNSQADLYLWAQSDNSGNLYTKGPKPAKCVLRRVIKTYLNKKTGNTHDRETIEKVMEVFLGERKAWVVKGPYHVGLQDDFLMVDAKKVENLLVGVWTKC